MNRGRIAVAVVVAVLCAVASGAGRAAASTRVAGAAWNCSVFGYLFQSPGGGSHEIVRVDLASGAAIRYANTRDSLNAIGYNTLDNFMYGWDLTTSTIVRVASDGTTEPLGNPTGTSDSFTLGDFDEPATCSSPCKEPLRPGSRSTWRRGRPATVG